jgi:hypothetical protein
MIAALKATLIREKRGKRADRAKRTQTANRKQTQSGHSLMMPSAPSTTIDVAVNSAQNGSTSLTTHDNIAPGTAPVDRRNHAKLAMFPIPEHNNKIMDVISPHPGTDATLAADQNASISNGPDTTAPEASTLNDLESIMIINNHNGTFNDTHNHPTAITSSNGGASASEIDMPDTTPHAGDADYATAASAIDDTILARQITNLVTTDHADATTTQAPPPSAIEVSPVTAAAVADALDAISLAYIAATVIDRTMLTVQTVALMMAFDINATTTRPPPPVAIATEALNSIHARMAATNEIDAG